MTVSRRFFLKGLGATVAIPVLPSLLTPREARAQAATPTPCFAAFSTNHGGVKAENMFPFQEAAPLVPPETQAYAGRTIRRWQLTAARANGLAAVSPVLTAPEGALTAGLLGKMFTVQGVGIPWYIAHHTGACLGNYAARCDHGGVDAALAPRPRRTIDQVMAWSPSFYSAGDLASVLQRVMVTASNASYNYSNPSDPTSSIQAESGIDTPGRLFDALFPQQGTPTQRPPIVDRVREAYQRLRSSPRISRADRDRLDGHIARLDEVERRLGTIVQCGAVTRPTNPSMELSLGQVSSTAFLDPGAHAQYHQAYNDVFVLAFSCGVSRIAVSRIDLLFSPYSGGDWHQDVAHQYDVEADATHPVDKQRILAEAQQRVFANVVVDLAAKLDAVSMGDGTTLLDRTLVTWSQESGNQTHDTTTIPVVCFGGAQGSLRTGFHHDYRNLALPFGTSEKYVRYPGLVWNQWLGTILQAMRIPRDEWENTAICGGYPDYAYMKLSWVGGVDENAAWPRGVVWPVSGQVLPWLARA
jgi:hypothetical protein